MFKFLILLTILTKSITTIADNTEDEYLLEKNKQCKLTKKPVDCFKYRIVKYLNEYGNTQFLKTNSSRLGPFKLVKISNENLFINGINDTVRVLGEVRQFTSDSEFDKVLKFLKRLINNILQTYAIQVPLPSDGHNIIVLEGDDRDENDDSINEIGEIFI